MLFSWEKKKAKKNTPAEIHTKTVYDLQKKMGWIRERRSYRIFSPNLNWLSHDQCVFKASFCWQRLSFLYDWPGSSLSAKHFIQAIYWKKMARFQFNSWVCSQPRAAGDGCTAYGYFQAASHRKSNVCRQEPRFKQRGNQVHDTSISWAKQFTPKNCPLSDSPHQHPSELLSATLENC